MHTNQVTTLTKESIEEYRSSLFARGLSQNTCKAYSSDLSAMLTFFKVESIHRVEMERMASQWLTSTRTTASRTTTRRRLTSVKSFASWARWGDILEDYRPPSIAPAMPHPLPEGMDGVRKMLRVNSKPEHKALIALCAMAGLRVGEAISVKPSDFDLSKNILKVTGKGYKVRHVPVSDELFANIAEQIVRNYETDTPLVGLADRWARIVITNIANKAGLSKHVASHDLRATFATELYKATKDIKLVARVLGHSSVTTTQVYIESTHEEAMAAVSLISQLAEDPEEGE